MIFSQTQKYLDIYHSTTNPFFNKIGSLARIDDVNRAALVMIEKEHDSEINALMSEYDSEKKKIEEEFEAKTLSYQKQLNEIREYQNKIPSVYRCSDIVGHVDYAEPYDLRKAYKVLLSISDTGMAFLKTIPAKKFMTELEAGANYCLSFINEAQKKASRDIYELDNKYKIKRKRLETKADEDKVHVAESAIINTPISVDTSITYRKHLNEYSQLCKDIPTEWNVYETISSVKGYIPVGYLWVPENVPETARKEYKSMMRSTCRIIDDNVSVKIPFAVDTSTSIKFLVEYNGETCKKSVSSVIQTVMIQILRAYPQGMVNFLFVDPVERGTSIGRLNILTNEENCSLCTLPSPNAANIESELRRLRSIVDERAKKLAAIGSIYDYNRNNDDKMPFVVAIINDYPTGLTSVSLDCLKVLNTNADKCGVSLIITHNTDESEPKVSGAIWEQIQRDFVRLDIKHTGDTAKVFTIYNNKSCEVEIASSDSIQDEYLRSIQKAYITATSIDTRCTHFYDFKKPVKQHEVKELISVPFMINSRNQLEDLQIGGSTCAHSMLSGVTGIGKTTMIHGFILSICLNYSPEDVQLWLIDYKINDFSLYKRKRPPHVTLLGLDDSPEFSVKLLNKINDEYKRRQDLFVKYGVKEYSGYWELRQRKLLNGEIAPPPLPRLVIIIDEFHELSNVAASDNSYKELLESLLSMVRSTGMTFFLSDQSADDGLRGLTAKAKEQITNIMVMRHKTPTAALNDLYADRTLIGDIEAFKRKLDNLGVGSIMLNHQYKMGSVVMSEIVEKNTIYFHHKEDAENSSEIFAAIDHINYCYHDFPTVKCAVVDNTGRKNIDRKDIEEHIKAAPIRNDDIRLYLGKPLGFEPVFSFSLGDEDCSNCLIVGEDTELTTSLIHFIVDSSIRYNSITPYVFVSAQESIYRSNQLFFENLKCIGANVITDIDSISVIIRDVTERIKCGEYNRQIIIFVGLERILRQFEMRSKSSVQRGNPLSSSAKLTPSISDISRASVVTDTTQTDLKSGVSKALELLMAYGTPTDEPDSDYLSKYKEKIKQQTMSRTEDNKQSLSYSSPGTTNVLLTQNFDMKSSIKDIFEYGSDFGVHSVVLYNSVYSLKSNRTVDPDCFGHKIALDMARDDSYSYLGNTIANGLKSIEAVYAYNGKSAKFVPFNVTDKT